MKPLTPTTPHVIIMVGIPGAGKTTFAEHFAKTFHAPFVNAAELAAITDTDSATGTKIAAKMLGELLKTQRTVIYEGDTATRTARQTLSRLVAAAGYKALVVWVQTETVEAKRRALRKRAGHAPLSSDEFDAAVKRFTPPTGADKIAVISGKHTYATQVKAVLKHLAGPRPEPDKASESRVRSGRNIFIR